VQDLGIEVGIGDPRPGQAEDLEVAALDVVVEGGELVGADLEADARLARHRLDDLRLQQRGLVGRGLVGEREAGQRSLGPVGVGESGLVEQRAGRRRVVGERRQLLVARPVAGRHQRLGGRAEAAPEGRHQARPVDRERQRSAHPHVGEARIAQVQSEVDVVRAGRFDHPERRVGAEQRHHVGRHAVDHELDAPLAQLEHAHGGVRHLAQDHAGERRPPAVPAVERRELDRVGGARDEAERSAADRRAVHLLRGGAARDDAEIGGQVGEQRAVRLAQVEVDGEPVDRHDPLERGQRSPLGARHRPVGQRAEGPDDVGRLHRPAVVETDAVAQVEAPTATPVEKLPGEGEVGHELARGGLGDQPARHQLEDPGGGLVGRHPRIEVDRGRLERDGERGVGGAGGRRRPGTGGGQRGSGERDGAARLRTGSGAAVRQHPGRLAAHRAQASTRSPAPPSAASPGASIAPERSAGRARRAARR